jgi:hypothetical protein
MTDATLAERLARCVKPLRLTKASIFEAWVAQEQELHSARILAALDMDALAREVEAMMGERTVVRFEGPNEPWAWGGQVVTPDNREQLEKAIATAIRAREGGKP